jgi:hypothetical protein
MDVRASSQASRPAWFVVVVYGRAGVAALKYGKKITRLLCF